MTEARDFTDNNGPKVHFKGVSLSPPPGGTPPLFSDDAGPAGPERWIEDNFKPRPRSKSHHLSATKVPSRSWLRLKATVLRNLMSLGMFFHDFTPPKPPKSNFKRTIATDTIPIELLFYLPKSYDRTLKANPDHQFPIVVNFHGGGFVLGDATDDRYWAGVVKESVEAVFVSVNYRRAPEHPFPTPVDDGVEAMLYLAAHATELHLDPHKTCLAGFSAGANLAFTVPFRLTYHKRLRATSTVPANTKPASDLLDLTRTPSTSSATSESHASPDSSTMNLLKMRSENPFTIVSIVAWYPLLDWTSSRAAKKRASRNPKKTLPKAFTDLFDFSYLPPPDIRGDHVSPYCSPGLAPEHMIVNGLPADIQLWLCEYDMLLNEGQLFAERLENLNKKVDTTIIPKVPHGFDKSPNPWRDQKSINALYDISCERLKEVFNGSCHEGECHRSRTKTSTRQES